MNREELLNKVKEQMTEHRFVHTLGVADTAMSLARHYGADAEQAYLAGILHDYCKFWDKGKMQTIIQEQESIASDLLLYDKELWHAPVGAYAVQQELAIHDQHVLNAIRYHTSGKPDMTLLEKIIWLADYIEPGRHFPGVDEVRELAKESLDLALIQAFANTISFLAKQKKRIYPLTIAAYNDLISKADQNGKEKGE